jgi:glycerol-3-phosphate dehydrogenase
MWTKGWRDEVWKRLETEAWDLVVVGGGITGAGILAESSKLGLKTILVEARDFASGTSSRSTKLVHGGLRYLRNAQFRLTRESVTERERLLGEASGLVMPLGFTIASLADDRMPGWMFGAGLVIYDVLAKKWAHERWSAKKVVDRCPPLAGAPLKGGYHYYDAQTDDARLVVRVLREAVRRGGTALNYARAEGLLRDRKGKVRGVAVGDTSGETSRTAEVKARAVINATGVWADDLRVRLGADRRLRAIRGSHLVFPAARLPIPEAVSLLHPRDHRFVFAVPWEGVTLFGTTDIDHPADLDTEPRISDEEAGYLLEAAQRVFPSLKLTSDDVRSTFAGVRGVVGTGARDPSKESREHALWSENGLLTVTGGKLTTFRLMALSALRALDGDLVDKARVKRQGRILDDAGEAEVPVSRRSVLSPVAATRLVGRHGADAAQLLRMGEGADQPIDGTMTLWGELTWAARAEGVVHLDDLLLRRTRLGLLLEKGGAGFFPRIRQLVQKELGWDDARWEKEVAAYTDRWRTSYRSLRI